MFCELCRLMVLRAWCVLFVGEKTGPTPWILLYEQQSLARRQGPRANPLQYSADAASQHRNCTNI